MTTVTDLLKNKGAEVATITQTRTIADAVTMLKERGIGALVVTGQTPPLVGILSERDVVRALATSGAAALSQSVSELMSANVTTCTLETSVTDLMGLMTANRIRHVPVVEGDRLAGMVSIGDVVFARFNQLENEKKTLLDYVQSW